MSSPTLNTLEVNMTGRCAANPIRRSEGSSNTVWLGKDGALTQEQWVQALTLEGRVFTMTIGTLVTAVTGGGAGTVPVIDLPEGLISVPSGTVIAPLRIAIQGRVADAVADNAYLQAFACVDRVKEWDGTGTCTAETAFNLRTDNPRATSCTCRSAFNTVAITSAPIHHIDLARTEVKLEKAASGETPVIIDLLYKPNPAPLIVGPAMLVVYWGGTSVVTGFAQIFWAEWPKSELGF